MKTLITTMLLLLVITPTLSMADLITYEDPFDFCKAVRNVDTNDSDPSLVDKRYVGENPPSVISKTMGVPMGILVVWRCMDGNVYGCELGASGRACTQWKNVTSSPTKSIRHFCANHPNNHMVAYAYNDTPWEWVCRGTVGVIDTSEKKLSLDKRGYYRDCWKKIPTAEPAKLEAARNRLTVSQQKEAKSNVVNPRLHLSVQADLDKDGKPEQINLVPFESDPLKSGLRYMLVVKKNNEEIWRDSGKEFPCYIGDFGVEDLQLVGDIDNDGYIELLIPDRVSDVSPSGFRILQWNGKRFVLKDSGIFKADKEMETFSLVKNPGVEGVTWISSFDKLIGPGVLKVDVFSLKLKDGSHRSATVGFDGKIVNVGTWEGPWLEW